MANRTTINPTRNCHQKTSDAIDLVSPEKHRAYELKNYLYLLCASAITLIMPLLTRQPRTLLITLDAFGTLYRPRKSIAIQYLDVAKSCGLHIEADTKDFGKSFRNAFKVHSSRSPNYGKATGMRPEKWWANVVNDTFKPLIQSGDKVPKSLPDSLFRHFSGEKGYELFPDTMPFFQQMRQWKQNLNLSPDIGVKNVLVGVLTNSDPRVAGVLESLGLVVGKGQVENGKNDLDFVLTSYEIGHEKPSPVAFTEAEQSARTVLGLPRLRDQSQDDFISDAIKVHIGDDLHKDYWGAIRSGRRWDAILLDRDSDENESPYHDVRHITKLTDAQAVLISFLQRSQK
jgi:REG-2-like HAD superfamily hydrolase